MSWYMLTLQITNETARSFISGSDDIEAQLQKALMRFDSNLRHFFYNFLGGDLDALGILESPDNVNTSALELALSTAGQFRSVKVQPIFMPEEALRLMQRAGQIKKVYQPRKA